MRAHSMLPLLILLAAALLIGACSDDSSTDKESASTSSTALDAGSNTVTTTAPGPPPGSILEGFKELEVGDCFEELTEPTAEDRAVWLLDCGQPHSYEVFLLTDYQGPGAGRGTSYPGTSAVQDFSEQVCFDQFEAFVGLRWTLSDLDIRAWWPTQESWERADRQVICTVVLQSGEPLTQTQRGSAR
ncbi:MAG: septum formation family protein [Microthrixaceae bacterium]